MLRLSPPRFERIRRAREFRIEVAGSQFNVAANLARFGKKTAFLTSLPENELGDLVIDEGAGYGMDTSHILRTQGSRVGLNFVEFTATPRTPRVVYDRSNSAASGIGPNAFDWEAILTETRVAHTDGIFPGLSTSCEEATERFLATAVAVGCRTTFDLNYREHIWSPERALECWSRLLP